MDRGYRQSIMSGRLVLISPYDPLSPFNVGHAMQRNMLIYALSDAGLVVSVGYKKGGTWNGAVEQIAKLKYMPVYVCTTGKPDKGTKALLDMGEQPWPNPDSVDALTELLQKSSTPGKDKPPIQGDFFLEN